MELTEGRLRELETLLPEIDRRLRDGKSTKTAISSLIKWRTDAATLALKQAAEYRDRLRERRRARSRRTA